ncbi:MAG: hypothetical protein M1834_009323 [Cirrosporium novae-zelandiae]|nr:MAG: hypothetical protein M1834_009323 [Cirrosporium novae-zelandiae]
MAEVRRTVLSCARCRRRKIKCDRRLPACSACVTSGSSCVGFNSKGTTEVPRSVVLHLEEEIARIEIELGHCVEHPDKPGVPIESPDGQLDTEQVPTSNGLSAPTDGGPLTMLTDSVKECVMASPELEAMIMATKPPGPSISDSVSRIRMGLTPSRPVVPAATSDKQGHRGSITARPAQTEPGTPLLCSIPGSIIHGLVKKYVTHILPSWPLLYEPTVWAQLETTLQLIDKTRGSLNQWGILMEPPNYDVLVIHLILAISVTLGSAQSAHESRCMALSESLFKEGITHMSNKLYFPNDLANLQATLLILQYACINPKAASVWILSGAAMRTCVELGIHREASESNNMYMDPVTMDLRRRVFWFAYCMDRSICSALQRPLSIPDSAIDACFPSLLGDQSISGYGFDQRGSMSKISAFRWIEYYQLQSSMIEVHFQGKPLETGQSWDDWLQLIERRLRQWYQNDPDSDEETEFAFWHGLAILHRPSPRVPSPSAGSLLTAFEAASASARIYHNHLLSGFYRRPWLAAHHTLEMSMVVLYCLRNGFEHISKKFKAHEIFEMTKLFTSNFLTISQQGWPEISEYAAIYERLLGPLLESVFTRSNNPKAMAFGLAQDEELSRLLYPGPAHLEKLRFGTTKEPCLDIFPPFNIEMFDFESEYHDLIASTREEMFHAIPTAFPASTPAIVIDEGNNSKLSSPSSSTQRGDVENEQIYAALKLLPSCLRCRRLRRKCDLRLPGCKHCMQVGVSCNFKDPALEEDISRSYVHALKLRYEGLVAKKAASLGPVITSTLPGNDNCEMNDTTAAMLIASIKLPPGSYRASFDGHYRIRAPFGHRFAFFGKSSTYALCTEVLSLASFKNPTQRAYPWLPPLPNHFGFNDRPSMIELPPNTTILDMLTLFQSTINVIYPFINGSKIQEDLDVYLTLHSQKMFNPAYLSPTEAYQHFRVTMMCAIACVMESRHDQSFAACADTFFADAEKCVESVTSETAPDSLQALLLLVVFHLFQPQRGEIWTLLDFACRLAIELGYHTEQALPYDENHVQELRRGTFWSLYTIERIVGQLYGRPSDLPEPIITTGYPSILSSVLPTDQETVQMVSSAHHYRLVYLRSEIYKETYLSATPIHHDLSWLEERYIPLLRWHENAKTRESLEGVGTVTCNVAYHSTVIFLFQPLVLETLAAARKTNSLSGPKRQIPADSYWSARELIRCYERVIRAPNHSPLGIYPMTFMSAHYVVLAAATLLAHWLLAVDKQTEHLQPLYEVIRQRIPQSIVDSEIFELSHSTVAVLSWCGERWKGLLGMLDIYRRVSEEVLPEFIRNMGE